MVDNTVEIREGRCAGCPFMDRHTCLLLFGWHSPEGIEKCPLEYEGIKDLAPDSLGRFLLNTNQIKPLYQYIGVGKTLDIGDRVFTLRSGFGKSHCGRVLEVISIIPRGYIVKPVKPSVCDQVGTGEYVLSERWWMDALKIEGDLR